MSESVIITLPPQLTPFIGRLKEIAEITRLLNDPTCRLLTLTGPGGIGKTRLAIEAARLMQGDVGTRHVVSEPLFPNNVYFVPFQPLTAPDFMVSTIADAIGFQFYPGAEPKQQLLDFFREKSILLIMDNLEHLLDGVHLLSEILAYALGVKMLTTSRERLRLLEEWVYEVRQLNYPDNETETDIKAYDAVQLFVQHARRLQTDFAPTALQKPAVIRICRLVGGLPLGIELAAAWVRVLSCEDIADEIASSLDILETPVRNVEPRHRTMRAAFEPTWARLSENEQAIFMKLSVFRGGFTREAAEYVAGATLCILSALVDKSLVKVDANGRYDLHELLRQYGEEQLNASPEELDQTRDLHSSYYAEFMHRQWAHLKSYSQRSALAEIGVEVDNVRAAWAFMVENRKAAEIHKTAYSLRYFLELRTGFREALELFRRAAEALRPAASDQKIGIVFGLALALEGLFYTDMGEPAQGRALAVESLAVLSQLNNPEAVMAGLESLAAAQFHLNQMLECPATAQEGVRIARECGDRWRTASFLRWLAWSAEWNRENAEWLQLDREGLALAEHLGDQSLMALFYNGLGGAALAQGHYEEAQRLLTQGLRLCQETHNIYGVCLAYWRLGALATAQKNFAEARYYYWQELELDLEVSNRRWQTNTTLNVSKLLAAQSQQTQAVELAALILHHPATMQYNRDVASAHLTELQAELAQDVFVAAVERGKARDLETTVRELIAEFSQPEKTLAHTRQPSPDDLTERELEILHLVAAGMSNKEIADQLFLAVGTVKWHLSEIFGKLHVANRTQAVARARAMGLLS